MTQIASRHNQPAFKDISGHMRSLEVICKMWILLNCSFYSDYCKPLEKPDSSAVWEQSGCSKSFFEQNGYFQKKWIFFRKMDFETKESSDFRAISLFYNPYFHTLKFGNYLSRASQPVSRCAWPITNYFRPTCLSQGTLPTVCPSELYITGKHKGNESLLVSEAYRV